MEFKEFTNPEEKNYDINTTNPYSEQLYELIGILKNITDEELYEKYGITMSEYLNPTAETIDKVIDKITDIKPSRR